MLALPTKYPSVKIAIYEFVRNSSSSQGFKRIMEPCSTVLYYSVAHVPVDILLSIVSLINSLIWSN